MSKNYSSQRLLSKVALTLPLVMIIAGAGMYLGGSAGLAGEGDLSQDEMVKLKAVEEKLFIRTYDDDASEPRIARIEKRMFGDSETGSVHPRLSKIVEIAKPFDKPKNAGPRGNGTRSSPPVRKQLSAEDERLRQEDAREQSRQRALAAAADEVNQLLAEAVSLYKAQRGNEAMEKFQQVVRLAPDNAEAHFSMGVIFESQHHYNEALACYKRAANLNPQKRDYQEAVAIAQKKAKNDESNDPQKAELKALALAASAAYKRGEFFSALDLYKQLDQKAPNQAMVKGNIGTIYLALKNPVQGLEYFQQAHRLKPDEPSYREACDHLEANLRHNQESRLATEKAWQNPGKTTINMIPNTNSGGNRGNSASAKVPLLTTSYGLMLRHHKDGVEITTIGIGSRAAQCGLLRGDLIKAVDGVVVESPEQLNQIFSTKGRAQMQLLIQRGPKIGQVVF